MPSLSGAASGASSGAGIGSMVMPGLGTAIGAGIGGLVGLFKGGKKKKKAAAGGTGELDPNSPEGMLQGQAKKLQGQSSALLEQGVGDLGEASDYFSSLLGNDPGALMDATKAERGKVIDQYDTARQSIAEFGPRGGGTTSALANSRIQQANEISDVTAQAKQGAASATANIGATIAGLGMTAEQVASSDLNTVLDAMLSREGLAQQKSAQKASMWGGIAEAGASILGDWISSRGKD